MEGGKVEGRTIREIKNIMRKLRKKEKESSQVLVKGRKKESRKEESRKKESWKKEKGKLEKGK